MPVNLENSAVTTRLEKVSFHSNSKEGQCQTKNVKLPYIVHISHVSRVILKVLQAGLQWYVNWDLTDVQAGFWRGWGTRDQSANIRWIIEKARESQKNIYLCFTDSAKAFDCGKFLKRWEYQNITLHAFWETCMEVKKQQLKPDKEQHAGSKLGK